MIQVIINLGKWLEQRFPKKLLVLESDYLELKRNIVALNGEISLLREDITDAKNGIEIVVSRCSTIEASATHKEAVKTLVLELQKVKDEFSSLKTSLGFNRQSQTPPEIAAMLNGEPMGEQF